MNTRALHDDDPVIYLAYGSNMLAARLNTYITGGTFLSGSHAGCRDTTAPICRGVVTVPHQLSFAFSSPYWNGGGVAFLHPTPSPTRTSQTVAWQMTAGQFADLYQQENGGSPDGAPLTIPTRPGDHTPRWGLYDTIVRFADLHDLPTMTITGVPPRRPNTPSSDYLATMADGLAAARGVMTARTAA